jgi:Protein NO VEIN, C-terminal
MTRLSGLTQREAVVETIQECQSLGRQDFLKHYGFGPARTYLIEYEGNWYDSKAIAGVAIGKQHPANGPLTPSAFRGEQAETVTRLRSLGFRLIPLPLVLVENEVRVREAHDWNDCTGQYYHYPHKYYNMIVPGQPFVYYRGKLRSGGVSGTPEYFGFGTIDAIYPDPMNKDWESKTKQRWYCSIANYQVFTHPLPAKKQDGSYYEEVIKVNHWRDGVRSLWPDRLASILRESGSATQRPMATTSSSAISLPMDSLLVPWNGKAKVPHWNTGGPTTPTKEIGDLGELIALKHLKEVLPILVANTLRWTARDGDKPGWDIEYVNESDDLVALEVKSTTGARHIGIELTANEWRAAERMRDRYNLVLVTMCRTDSPRICIVSDPWGLWKNGLLEVTPTSFRLRSNGEQ